MFWSLVKIVLFIAAIAALALGAGYLSETGGGVRIAFGGMEFNLGPLQAVIVALVLIFAIWLMFKLLGLVGAVVRFLSGDETALSRYFDRSRERRGFEALAEGLTALASGEGRLAMAKAAKAEKYLRRPDLTNLIAAQAAEISGDRRKAVEIYKRLLADERTRFVGIRGLMKQKLAEGDTDTAMKLAERAFALKPRHQETGDILLRLQAEHEDWKGARKTLSAKLRHGALPRDVYKRRDAVLALSEAREVIREGNTIEAREAAIEANRLSPDLVPAAVMAAQAYIADGKPRLATRVLKKAWAAQPHPDLAAAFASIVPDEGPEERLRRFQLLTKINPKHPETRMLLAELHIAAGEFAEARRALGDLVEKEPTARVLALMAAIERGEGSDDAVVRGWLAKAVSAPRGPQWVCENCQSVHADWAPVCSQCGGFDTLAWKTPPDTGAALPASTAMLPLIVGQKDEKEDQPEAEAEPQEEEAEARPEKPRPPAADAPPEPEEWEREI